MLKVNEIFYSIQGESTHTGRPCIFIRLTGCNLRCTYCDTEYAFDSGESMSISGILDKIREYPCNLVEITGGEPLCQEETADLAQSLLNAGYSVLVETNGSFPVDKLPDETICIMDIKCPSSGESESMDWNNIRLLTPQDEIKFVIADAQDYQWAKEKISEYKLGTDYTILMGAAHPRMKPAELAGWILKDGLPVRLQVQLHKQLWPDSIRGK